jgi:hypothetical protein
LVLKSEHAEVVLDLYICTDIEQGSRGVSGRSSHLFHVHIFCRRNRLGVLQTSDFG